MNHYKRVVELREEQHRLTELQDAEERELLTVTDLYHGDFLAGRIKARAKRLAALATEIDERLDAAHADSLERRKQFIHGRTA